MHVPLAFNGGVLEITEHSGTVALASTAGASHPASAGTDPPRASDPASAGTDPPGAPDCISPSTGPPGASDPASAETESAVDPPHATSPGAAIEIWNRTARLITADTYEPMPRDGGTVHAVPDTAFFPANANGSVCQSVPSPWPVIAG
jgi:hypothetical protein